jgi:DNA-binding response OmpR family regulator
VTKKNLLIVDADTRSLRVLEVSLRNAGYNVAGCPSVGKALEILHANTPDLILSDTTFSDMNGFEFVEQLRQNSQWAEIPFMFLSSDGSIESKIRGLELGVEDYLTKPIYIREVIARVGIELARQARAGLAHKTSDARTRFSGSLSEMSVVDLLQTIDVSRKSGVLTLVSADGQAGMISFDSGAVINATVEDLAGEDAVYRQLLWRDGTFDLEFRSVNLSDRTVHRTTQALLMEGMRRLDEWSRLSELLPSFDAVLEVDGDMLRERLRDMPDEQNEMVRLIDGWRTVAQVLRAHGGDHVEALRKIVDLYFEGMVREVGRIEDSIPVLTEVSARSSAPSPREVVQTIPGPAGLPAPRLAVPAAPRVPTLEPGPGGAGWSPPEAADSPIPRDRRSTPVSFPSLGQVPAAASTEEAALGWEPAPPPPARPSRQTPKGFQAARPESSMYAGGTILNWAGRVPDLDRIEEISSRETLEIGQWDHTLDELREDPEVEEAIVAIDSDPPPAAFVRSTPPRDPAFDEAAQRHDPTPRRVVIDYHEPPDVDPPPLTYEQVFEEDSREARLRAPRPVQPEADGAERRVKRSFLPWALLVLAVGTGLPAVAYWMWPGSADAPTDAKARVIPPSVAPSTDTVPITVSETASETAPSTDTSPETAPALVPASPPIFPQTGAVDTYEAQLALARRLKRGARAAAAYERAIELNPQGSSALAELARLMLARNHAREAAELAERATAVDPASALGWVTLGAARQMRGDQQGARQAYRNCVKLGEGSYVSECRAMLR